MHVTVDAFGRNSAKPKRAFAAVKQIDRHFG
jgi:hypothetical protein